MRNIEPVQEQGGMRQFHSWAEARASISAQCRRLGAARDPISGPAVEASALAGPTSTELYKSSNGDRWSLIKMPAGRMCVRHEPAAASGGEASDTDLETFLARGGERPERRSLLQVLARGG